MCSSDLGRVRGLMGAPRKKPAVTTATPLTEYQSYHAIIRQIPRGSVLTYGDVAQLAGRPGSARRVGYSLAALKDQTVPWWRVVAAAAWLYSLWRTPLPALMRCTSPGTIVARLPIESSCASAPSST